MADFREGLRKQNSTEGQAFRPPHAAIPQVARSPYTTPKLSHGSSDREEPQTDGENPLSGNRSKPKRGAQVGKREGTAAKPRSQNWLSQWWGRSKKHTSEASKSTALRPSNSTQPSQQNFNEQLQRLESMQRSTKRSLQDRSDSSRSPLAHTHTPPTDAFRSTPPRQDSLRQDSPRLEKPFSEPSRSGISRLERDLLEKKRLEKARIEKRLGNQAGSTETRSSHHRFKPAPPSPSRASSSEPPTATRPSASSNKQPSQELSRKKVRDVRLRDRQRRSVEKAENRTTLLTPTPGKFGITATASRLSGRRASASKSIPQAPRSPMAKALLYGIRLLILGVGIGAIAGTLLAVSDRANHPSAQASQTKITESRKAQLQSNLSSISGASSALNLGQEMLVIKNQIQALMNQNAQLAPGIFIFDPDTSNYLDVNGGNPFPAASIIKLPILVALFQDVDAGQVRLDEPLSLKAEMIAEGSGDLQFRPVGSQYTVMETATKMITISDNTATNMLIVRLGGAAALNRRFQSWGLHSTVINQPLPDMQGTNLTSPKDMANLMAMVGEGKLISMRSRDSLLDILRRTVNNSLLPSGIDAGATIAHKTGDIGTLLGDVGLIDLPNGKRYIAAVLVKSAYNDPQASEFIRQVSRTVYQAMIQPTLQAAPTGAPGNGASSGNATPSPIPSISPQGNSGGNGIPETTSESPHPLLNRQQTQVAQP